MFPASCCDSRRAVTSIINDLLLVLLVHIGHRCCITTAQAQSITDTYSPSFPLGSYSSTLSPATIINGYDQKQQQTQPLASFLTSNTNGVQQQQPMTSGYMETFGNNFIQQQQPIGTAYVPNNNNNYQPQQPIATTYVPYNNNNYPSVATAYIPSAPTAYQSIVQQQLPTTVYPTQTQYSATSFLQQPAPYQPPISLSTYQQSNIDPYQSMIMSQQLPTNTYGSSNYQSQSTANTYGSSNYQPQSTANTFGSNTYQPHSTANTYGSSTYQPQSTANTYGSSTYQTQLTPNNIMQPTQQSNNYGGDPAPSPPPPPLTNPIPAGGGTIDLYNLQRYAQYLQILQQHYGIKLPDEVTGGAGTTTTTAPPDNGYNPLRPPEVSSSIFRNYNGVGVNQSKQPLQQVIETANALYPNPELPTGYGPKPNSGGSKPIVDKGTSQQTNRAENDATTAIGALTQQIRRLPAVFYVDSRSPESKRSESLLRETYGLPLVAFYVDKIENSASVARLLHQLTGHEGLPYFFVCGTFIGSQQHIDNYHTNGQVPQLVEYVCGDEKNPSRSAKMTTLMMRKNRRKLMMNNKTTSS